MARATRSEKRAALLVAAFASFLTPFMGSSVNVALPSIGSQYSADAIQLSWIATSYLLAAAVFLIPVGRIADIIGRRKVFLAGIILFSLSSILCGSAHSVLSLIIYRVFQAIGSAMIFGTGMAIITSVYPAHERGKAMGIVVAAVYVGLSFGPFAGGIFTQHLGWRSLFFFVGALGLFVIYFTVRNLKGEWAEAKGEKFDWQGSCLYAVALILIMYGFPNIPETKAFVYLVIGLIVLIVFILWELRIEYPVLDLSLFKDNIVFRYSNLAALINYSATFAVAFLLSFYLQYVKGYSPQETGLILVAQPIVMAVLSPVAGRLSDRVEPGVVAAIGMGLSAVGLFLLIFLSQETSVLKLIIILIVLGLGFALFSSPNSNAIMGSVEKKFLGVASGSLGTMRLVGQMLSMGVAMMLLALYLGSSEIISSNHAMFLSAQRTAFIIFSVLCFIGVFASLARGKLRE